MTLEKQNHQASSPKGKSCQPDPTGAPLSTQVFPTEEKVALQFFFLQYIAVDVAFPKPFYEYSLFTKRIIREAAPITLSTMLILGRYSESKCFNTSLHL